MGDQITPHTAPDVLEEESAKLTGLRRSAAVLLWCNLAAATARGAQQWYRREDTAETQNIEVLAESSTQTRNVTPEIQARLDAMLGAARHEIIEDGESNAVTERLEELFLRDSRALIPALARLIVGARTPPIIAAEILKELGRMRDPASHWDRRWLLERALSVPSPFVKDGAGLGLARLGDPEALRYLRRAIDAEADAQTRTDLQLVVDELTEAVR